MKASFPGLVLILSLVVLPASAQEEKPQAIYDVIFDVSHGFSPLLKPVSGASPLGLTMSAGTGSIEVDEKHGQVVKTGGGLFSFAENFNHPRRYVLKGEMRGLSSQSLPTVTMSTNTDGRGDVAQFVWKDLRGTEWQSFELSCAVGERSTASATTELAIRFSNGDTELRRLQLVEYGESDDSAAQAVESGRPIPASGVIPSRFIFWFGIGCGVVGVVSSQAVWRLGRRVREQRREKELRKIAALDAAGR